MTLESPAVHWPNLVDAAKKTQAGGRVVFNMCGMELEGGLINYGGKACRRGHNLPHGRIPPRSTVSADALGSTLAKLTKRDLVALKEAAVHHMLVAILAEDMARVRQATREAAAFGSSATS